MIENGKANTEDEVLYGTYEVSRMAAVSLRQLQWWDEKKVVRAHVKSGHQRRYRRHDVFLALVVANLRHRKMPLMKVRRVLKYLGKLDLTKFQCLPVLAVSPSGDHHCLVDTLQEVTRLCEVWRGPVLAIDLQSFADMLEKPPN